jgi:hypothetical protein
MGAMNGDLAVAGQEVRAPGDRWRLAGALGVLAVLASATLLLMPVETLPLPPAVKAQFPGITIRFIAAIQPLMLLVIAVAVGVLTAPSVGLDAPVLRALIRRRPALPVLRRQIVPALIVGVVGAAVVALYGWATKGLIDAPQDFAMPALTRLGYGGVGEEIMLRWGVMSLFVWIAWRLGGRRGPGAVTMVGASAMAALLFGAGHLPLVFQLVDAPSVFLILMVVIANAAIGFLCGLLFWRRGLEAAMIAHAVTHALLILAELSGLAG